MKGRKDLNRASRFFPVHKQRNRSELFTAAPIGRHVRSSCHGSADESFLKGLLSMKAYIGIRCIATGVFPNWGHVGFATALIGAFLKSAETTVIGSILMRISKAKEPLFRPGDLTTAAEVCKLLGVSRTKLWKMHQDGTAPPHIDLGRGVRRYSRPAVMQWLQKALQ